MRFLNVNSGFTLAELAVAMLVTTVALTVAIPAFSKIIQEMRVHQEASKVAYEIRTARILAVSRNTSYRVDLNTTDPAVRLWEFNADTGSYALRKITPIGPGAASITISPAAAIQFNPIGNASGESTVTLIGDGGEQYRVLVVPPGRVEVVR